MSKRWYKHVALLSLLVAGTLIAADAPEAPVRGADGKASHERLREGTRLVDQLGYFETSGDVLTFRMQADGRKLIGLPNVALERIGRTVGDSPDALLWTVSGTVTEYHGANYLLVTQSTVKRRESRTP